MGNRNSPLGPDRRVQTVLCDPSSPRAAFRSPHPSRQQVHTLLCPHRQPGAGGGRPLLLLPAGQPGKFLTSISLRLAGTQVNFSKPSDAFAFEEDSSNDGLSPEQARSEDSQGSTESSAGTKSSELPPSAPSGPAQVGGATGKPHFPALVGRDTAPQSEGTAGLGEWGRLQGWIGALNVTGRAGRWQH